MLTRLGEARPATRLAVALGGVVLAAAVYGVANAVKSLPIAVVVLGIVLGGLNAMVAMGFVLIYKATRVINFAQVAIGSLSTALTIYLWTHGWSYWSAVPLGLLSALGVGVLIDRLFVWRLSRGHRLMFTVATIGMWNVLGAGAVEFVLHFGSSTKRAPTAFFGGTQNLASFTAYDAFVIGVVVVAMGALYFFLQRTDTGVAVRAAADSTERATLLGIPVRRLSMFTWMIAAALSGVGALLATRFSSSSALSASGFFDPKLLLLPLAAAVLAGMESLASTVVWSLVLSVVYLVALYYGESASSPAYSYVIDAALIVIGLLLRRRRDTEHDRATQQTLPIREARPLPAAVLAMRRVQVARLALVVAALAVAVVVPLQLSEANVGNLSNVAIFGIIVLSVVVLAGWAGQISLGQSAFVGLGAATAGSLLVHAHLNFLLTMVCAAAVGAVAACVVGIPALRLPGLNLAVATMAFAVPVATWVLNPSYSYFAWLNPPQVSPPVLFKRFDLSSQYAFYELCLITLVACLFMARNLRRSRAGRIIVSVRDNPVGASVYGVSPLRARLTAFVFSGALAGIAGALYVVYLGQVVGTSFDLPQSFQVFGAAVIGGLGSLTGAFLGAVYVQVITSYLSLAVQYLLTGAALLAIPMALPEGIGGVAFWVRDHLVGLLVGRRTLEAATRGTPPESPEATSGKLAAGLPAGTEEVFAEESLARSAARRFVTLEEQEIAAESAAAATAPSSSPAAARGLVDVSGVEVSFGRNQVLFGITLTVDRGEVLAVLGTNGAGKSTTLRTIAGLVRPFAGAVSFEGRDIGDWPPLERVKSGIVTVLGGRGIFPSLTVAENLQMGAWVARRHIHDRTFEAEARERVLALFPRLAERLDQKAGFLSGGEQQMLALAQALMCRPRILMIDELSLGLAPTVVGDLLDVVHALATEGVTIVVVEQSVNVATALSSRAVVIERGRVRFNGATPDVARQPEMLRSLFSRAAARAGGADVAGPAVGNGSGPGDDDLAAFFAGSAGVDAAVRRPPAMAQAAGRPQEGAGDAGSPATPAFEVIEVSKNFGGVSALQSVSFEVMAGEILGIIGSNGAGKTTLFDVCSGFTAPDAGRVRLFGSDATSLSPAQRARLGLGRAFQDARLFTGMTVRETLAVALEQWVEVRDPLACALGLGAVDDSEQQVRDRVEALVSEFDLGHVADLLVSELSTGTRRIVELACVVAHQPSVLLLDEPTSGVAQSESEALGELVLGVREETGAAFVVIEHDVPLVSSIADRLMCMHLGEVIATGTPAEVLADPAVVAAYLGSDDIASGRASLERQRVGVGVLAAGASRVTS